MIDQIDQDIINSLKSGDTLKRDTLRLLKSVISNYRIDNQLTEISDQVVQELIAKEIKKRKESIEAYKNAGREELAASEQQEIEILNAYLPEQLSEDELRTEIEQYLHDNPTEKSQMGRAMGDLKQKFAGQADMSVVSKILQEKL
ncbi:GatB/YqeY domain-containing protein [Candidatus Berkelbacteria bacterium]|nr:GatB/YqeY domain-containing protein [Candidatus Berkelbacteria bacterium]